MLSRILITIICLPLWAGSFSVDVHKTQKGISYWAHEIKDIEYLSFDIILKNCGSLYEATEKHGVASLLCDTLSRGGRAYSEEELSCLLKGIPCDLTIHDAGEHIRIAVRIPVKNLQTAFNILKKLFTSLDFPKEKLDLGRNQTIATLKQSLHIPTSIAMNKSKDFFIGAHPLNKQPETFLESLPKISPKDLKEHFNTISSEIFVSVAGKIDHALFSQLIDDFSSLFSKQKEKKKLSPVSFINLGQYKHYHYDVPQSVLIFSVPTINLYHEDYTALSIAIELLGGMESVMYKKIREEQGLVYDIGASVSEEFLFPNVMGYCACLPEKIPFVIKMLKDIFESASKELKDEEIHKHIQSKIHQFAFARSSSSQIAAILSNTQTKGRSPEWLTKRNARLEELTPQKIRDVLIKHVDTNKLTFFSLGRENVKKES